MADYIPAPDAEFNSWQVNFVTYANANLAGSPRRLDWASWGWPLTRCVSRSETRCDATLVRSTMRRVKGWSPVT